MFDLICTDHLHPGRYPGHIASNQQCLGGVGTGANRHRFTVVLLDQVEQRRGLHKTVQVVTYTLFLELPFISSTLANRIPNLFVWGRRGQRLLGRNPGQGAHQRSINRGCCGKLSVVLQLELRKHTTEPAQRYAWR